MDFVIFGFTDNFVLILGMYFSLDKYLKSFERNASNQLMLACVSAGLGNTFSDALGFLVTGNFTWTAFTIVGCLLGMIIIPIMEKIKN
jgi:hypothetical protein